jgi:hypothetical protein
MRNEEEETTDRRDRIRRRRRLSRIHIGYYVPCKGFDPLNPKGRT